LGNANKAGVTEEVERWLPILRERAEVLAVDLRQERRLDACGAADVALVFGGDGAILRAARQMGYHQTPVLGVNLGRLGFLADTPPDEFASCLEQLIARNFRVTRHLMFECLLEQSGCEPAVHLGLNEVAIHTMPPFHLLDLHIEIDGDRVAEFGGDGLIVSTPIGSTAHNLSAGGPILSQELHAFVLTPICPHTLSYRPVVESAERTYRIRLGQDRDHAQVTIDGQVTLPLGAGACVVIRRAPVEFQLVKMPGRSFYQTLRDKLRWAAQPGAAER
jgi:NAD+ kinase